MKQKDKRRRTQVQRRINELLLRGADVRIAVSIALGEMVVKRPVSTNVYLRVKAHFEQVYFL